MCGEVGRVGAIKDAFIIKTNNKNISQGLKVSSNIDTGSIYSSYHFFFYLLNILGNMKLKFRQYL